MEKLFNGSKPYDPYHPATLSEKEEKTEQHVLAAREMADKIITNFTDEEQVEILQIIREEVKNKRLCKAGDILAKSESLAKSAYWLRSETEKI